MGNGTLQEVRGIEAVEGQLSDLDAGIGSPQKAAACHVRMQRAYEHGDSPERNPTSDETAAELGKHLVRQRYGASAVR